MMGALHHPSTNGTKGEHMVTAFFAFTTIAFFGSIVAHVAETVARA